MAWLANGEFVVTGAGNVEVDYTIADEVGGGRHLDLRLRLPPPPANPN